MDSKLSELQGLALGISASGKILKAEAAFLFYWLNQNLPLVESHQTAKELYSHSEKILQNEKLGLRESKRLLNILHSLILPEHLSFIQECSHQVSTTSLSRSYDELSKLELIPSRGGIFSKVTHINFTESTFCFTGVFAFGDRAACQKATIALGGDVRKSMLKDDVYLVVGSLASPDWKHGNYGRKIEKALKYRNEGGTSKIIHEDTWAKFLCEGNADGNNEPYIIDNTQGPLL